MANRKEIIEKIMNLRAKAANAASTEAEAMTAAEMAAKLLTKHEIRPEELAEAKEEGAIAGAVRTGKILYPVAEWTINAISTLTETKGHADGGEAVFIGVESDVLMANYLVEMLIGTARRGWIREAETTYKRCKFNALSKYRDAYYRGFAMSVSERLRAMAAARVIRRQEAQGNSNSSALVVVKSAMIEAKMQEMGLTLVKSKRSRRYLDPKALASGMDAGANVNLGRPIEEARSAFGGYVE